MRSYTYAVVVPQDGDDYDGYDFWLYKNTESAQAATQFSNCAAAGEAVEIIRRDAEAVHPAAQYINTIREGSRNNED